MPKKADKFGAVAERADQRPLAALFHRRVNGDKEAEAAPKPIVYDELQRRAKRLFRSASKSHRLPLTAIVHESFVKLVDVDVTGRIGCNSFRRQRRMMRRLVTKHANASPPENKR